MTKVSNCKTQMTSNIISPPLLKSTSQRSTRNTKRIKNQKSASTETTTEMKAMSTGNTRDLLAKGKTCKRQRTTFKLTLRSYKQKSINFSRIMTLKEKTYNLTLTSKGIINKKRRIQISSRAFTLMIRKVKALAIRNQRESYEQRRRPMSKERKPSKN